MNMDKSLAYPVFAVLLGSAAVIAIPKDRYKKFLLTPGLARETVG